MRNAYNGAVPRLDELREEITHQSRQPDRMIGVRGSRVAQLDAWILDRELSDLVAGQIGVAVEPLFPSAAQQYNHEIRAAVDLIILGSTILTNKPTPGMRLQNLMFARTNRSGGPEISSVTLRRKLGYILGAVVVRWGWNRVRDKSLEEDWSNQTNTSWKRKIWIWMRNAEKIYASLTLLNLVLFLRNGYHRSVLERSLGMAVVPLKERAQNPMQFSSQNVQLMSNTLSEMMFFVVPLVNWVRVKYVLAVVLRFGVRWSRCLLRAIARRFERLKSDFIFGQNTRENEVNSDIIDSTPVTKAGVDSNGNRSETAASDRGLLERAVCASCGVSDVAVPYVASCGDIYCYVCLHALAQEAETSGSVFSCVHCGKSILSSRRAR